MQRAPHLGNEGIRLCLDIRLCPQFPYIAMDAKYEKLEAKLNQQCRPNGAEGDKDRNVTNVDGSYPKGKILHNTVNLNYSPMSSCCSLFSNEKLLLSNFSNFVKNLLIEEKINLTSH